MPFRINGFFKLKAQTGQTGLIALTDQSPAVIQEFFFGFLMS